MKVFTACAVRADRVFGFDKRYVHDATLDHGLRGLSAPESWESEVPFQITYGYSKDKRPDLKQFVLSTLCVDRAVPLWGKPRMAMPRIKRCITPSDRTLRRSWRSTGSHQEPTSTSLMLRW